MDAKKIFHETLRTEFAPRLREVGFRGSGQHFRRIRGEIINAVNVQANRHGGSCALNIGLHLTFIPDGLEKLPDVKTVKEIDCEFRNRVGPNGEQDFWWEYGDSEDAAQPSAEHLIATYFAVGEKRFQKFETIESIARMCPLELLKKGGRSFCGSNAFGNMPGTATRMALAMARIHKHLGDDRLAKEFAVRGLADVGRGTALIPIFQAIIDSCG
jgi:hypothetical protein